MTDDFEARMRRMVNAAVDDRLGPPRPAPAFEPQRAPRRRISPWVLPLAVAASVAAVVGGTVGVVRLASTDERVEQPGTNLPSPTPGPSPVQTDPAPSSPTPSSPTPSSPAATSPAATTPSVGGYTTMHLDDADVAVPVGWTAAVVPGGNGGTKVLCLFPSTGDVDLSDPAACSITVVQIAPGGGGGPAILVDSRGGTYGDPAQVCIPDGVEKSTVEADVRDFGGRPAEYRLFSIDCNSGNGGLRFAQYVVPTDRAYIVSAPHVDRAGVQSALDTVVAGSTLPDQDRPLRLEDYGIVRTLEHGSDGSVTITLDRVTESTGENDDPTTYTYVLSRSVAKRYPDLTVGKPTYVVTNGTAVVGM